MDRCFDVQILCVLKIAGRTGGSVTEEKRLNIENIQCPLTPGAERKITVDFGD